MLLIRLEHRSIITRPSKVCCNKSREHRTQAEDDITGTVIALYTLAGTFGAIACTFLGDVWGRRGTIFVAAAVNLVGALLMCTSFSFGQFIVSRIILGIGTGGIIATVSVWQTELSKASSRGAHVAAFGLFAGIGLVLALWLDFGCSYASTSFAWRFPLAFPMVLSAVVMTFIFTLPESPRLLMKKGKVDEARDILNVLHEDPEVVEKEIADIQLALELSGNLSEGAALKSMFTMGRQRIFHRVCLAAGVQIMLQLTGVNSITYYASSIYQSDLGFNPTTAKILAASSQFAICLGALICSFTVDRFGRRTLMLFSAAAMSICFAFETGLVSNPNNGGALKGAVFFLFLYYVVYTVGFLGIPFLYASEIAPVQLRGQICGISTAVSWLFNFLVAEITPVAFTDIGKCSISYEHLSGCRRVLQQSLLPNHKRFSAERYQDMAAHTSLVLLEFSPLQMEAYNVPAGWRYFIVYCTLNAAWVPIIFLFYPETSGRSLEEIDEIFARSKSIWDPVKVAQTLPRMHLVDIIEDPEPKSQVAYVEGNEKTKQHHVHHDPLGVHV